MPNDFTDPVIGEEFDGYRILEVLGQGGMGVVFKAEEIALERLVALKVINPSLANDDAFLRRIRQEAKGLARVDSPHIVRIHTLSETDLGHSIVMEYVDGETVADLIRREGSLSWQKAVSLIGQILTALRDAHSVGVIHRDIKPSNILLNDAGVAKITDFGLAKVERKSDKRTEPLSTRTEVVAGTLFYMSPEQVRGLGHVDHRSDLYSVGMTFYEMLTGTVPFDKEESEFAVMKKIVEEKLPLQDAFRDNIPGEITAIIRRALEKDPDRRFQSAQKMKDALESIDSSVEQTTGQSKESRYIRGAHLTAAVLLLAGVFLTYYHLEAVQSWFDGERVDAAEQPPAELVTEKLDDYVPEGFVVVDQPILAPQSRQADNSEYVYRIKLRAVEELYRVPVVDLKLPSSLPNQIREWSHLLRIDSELAPGKEYDINNAQQEIGPSEQIEAQWRVHMESRNGRWTLIEADTVKPVDLPSLSTGPNEEISFLTRQELDNFRRQRDEMLGFYRTRWKAFREDIDSFRAQTFREVPSPCPQKVTRLKIEVERLGERCPQISNAAERSECNDRQDSLKSELDACKSQNDLHLERHEKAKRLVKEYRRERLKALREDLVENRN